MYKTTQPFHLRMIQPTYFFGGDASDLGRVYQFKQTSFRTLVEQIFNVPVVLNTTRAEYSAMDKATRTATKRVPYIVPATFGSSPCQRNYGSATGISLLCLDIDNSDMARPYYNAPEILAEQLMPFNYVVHTTASSTEALPRIRIIVQAKLTLKEYVPALRDLARRIGLASVNTESRVAVQPMYLPTLFRDEKDFHPVLLSEYGGRIYVATDILKNSDAQSAPETSAPDDGLEFVRPILADVTLADVAGALKHLDPDMPYNDWLEVAMCMRHQFQRDAADQAYALFDEWSSQGTKYAGIEDTKAKWMSILPFTRNRAPLTIRTLLVRAAKAGWDSRTVAGRCYRATMEWVQQSGLRDVSKLFQEGLSRIMATPLLTSSEEETILRAIAKKARELDVVVSPVTLRKDLRRLKQVTQTKEKKELIPDWARGLCYIGRTDEFFRQSTGERLSPAALDRVYGSKLAPTEAQLKNMDDDIMRNKNHPRVRPQDYLLFEMKVPTVYDTVYDPLNANDVFIESNDVLYVNSYVRRYPEPDPVQAEAAGQLWMGHLTNLIGENKYRQQLMDFLAFIIQYPGHKIRYSVMLQGCEGCGKTFISEAMASIIGKEHVISIDSEALKMSWNDWANRAQLVTLEEIRVAGQNRHEIMNRLKPLISNDLININQRLRDSRTVANKANYILFTNHHDALPLTQSDRRYFVLKSPLQTKEQVLALGGKAYFGPLYQMIRENAAGLRAFFEQWPISDDFDPNGQAPTTTYWQEVLAAGTSEATAAIRELIEDQLHPLVQKDIVSSRVLMQQLEDYGLSRITGQYIGSLLRDDDYISIGRHWIGTEKHPLWVKHGSKWARQINSPRRILKEAKQRMDDNAEALL